MRKIATQIVPSEIQSKQMRALKEMRRSISKEEERSIKESEFCQYKGDGASLNLECGEQKSFNLNLDTQKKITSESENKETNQKIRETQQSQPLESNMKRGEKPVTVSV